MKKGVLGLLLIFFLFPVFSYAEEINAGFVQGLWYSSDEMLEGVPIRVYVALRNNTDHDLTGTIRFTDNGTRIGSSEVRALAGRLVEAWVDFTPTKGEHALSANLSNVTLHIIGGDTITSTVADIVVTDTKTVDIDTDKDGTGNTHDTDDDNDGVSDTEELSQKTDPLVPNTKIKTTTTEEKIDDTTTETKLTEETDTEDTENTASTKDGLEKYLDDGVTRTLLSNVTEKVEGAKQSLDTYRDRRNTEMKSTEPTNESPESLESTSTVVALGTYTDNATITRTKIETKNTLLSSFISGVASIFHSIWTFILFILSKVLTHPALIQVLLLIFIVYIFYRIARRMGSRPN